MILLNHGDISGIKGAWIGGAFLAAGSAVVGLVTVPSHNDDNRGINACSYSYEGVVTSPRDSICEFCKFIH